MIHRYLKNNPLEWLADGSDPAVTFLAKKELQEYNNDNSPIPDILPSSLFNDVLRSKVQGNTKNIDLFYKGAIWHFLFAVECGLTAENDFIKALFTFLQEQILSPDSGFSFLSNPPVSTGCRTGNMVRAILKSGSSPEIAEKGIIWIIRNQRKDGGWLHCPYSGISDSLKLLFLKKPGTGLKFEKDHFRESCPVATAACALALIESKLPEYKENINRAAEFLLSHTTSLYQKKRMVLQCGQSISLSLTGYPVMTQVDSTSILFIVFSSDYWDDKRAVILFNTLMKKQHFSGIWKSDNRLPGMIRGKSSDRWVTLNVMRLLKKLSEKEDQLEKA